MLWGPRYPDTGREDPSLTSNLFNRAWVFQERLLSPRVLRFEHSEMVLDCREKLACECRGAFQYQSIPLEPLGCMHIKEIFAYMLKKFSCNEEKLAVAWRWIVTEYSQLLMTMDSNNLPALSGIAQRAHQSSSDMQYVAGVWKHSILNDMLWMRRRGVRSNVEPMKRAVAWRAPS